MGRVRAVLNLLRVSRRKSSGPKDQGWTGGGRDSTAVASPLDAKASEDAEGDTVDYRGCEAVMLPLAPHLDLVRGHRRPKNRTFSESARRLVSETVHLPCCESVDENERVGGKGGLKETAGGKYDVEGSDSSIWTVNTRRNGNRRMEKCHPFGCGKQNTVVVGYVAEHVPFPQTKPSAPSATASDFVAFSLLSNLLQETRSATCWVEGSHRVPSGCTLLGGVLSPFRCAWL